jgi:hypothetical protein
MKSAVDTHIAVSLEPVARRTLRVRKVVEPIVKKKVDSRSSSRVRRRDSINKVLARLDVGEVADGPSNRAVVSGYGPLFGASEEVYIAPSAGDHDESLASLWHAKFGHVNHSLGDVVAKLHKCISCSLDHAAAVVHRSRYVFDDDRGRPEHLGSPGHHEVQAVLRIISSRGVV